MGRAPLGSPPHLQAQGLLQAGGLVAPTLLPPPPTQQAERTQQRPLPWATHAQRDMAPWQGALPQGDTTLAQLAHRSPRSPTRTTTRTLQSRKERKAKGVVEGQEAVRRAVQRQGVLVGACC